jgi:hypothetical protein
MFNQGNGYLFYPNDPNEKTLLSLFHKKLPIYYLESDNNDFNKFSGQSA